MANDLSVEKAMGVEHHEVGSDNDVPAIMGTTNLNSDELLLVPAPSSDPRGMDMLTKCPAGL